MKRVLKVIFFVVIVVAAYSLLYATGGGLTWAAGPYSSNVACPNAGPYVLDPNSDPIMSSGKISQLIDPSAVTTADRILNVYGTYFYGPPAPIGGLGIGMMYSVDGTTWTTFYDPAGSPLVANPNRPELLQYFSNPKIETIDTIRNPKTNKIEGMAATYEYTSTGFKKQCYSKFNFNRNGNTVESIIPCAITYGPYSFNSPYYVGNTQQNPFLEVAMAYAQDVNIFGSHYANAHVAVVSTKAPYNNEITERLIGPYISTDGGSTWSQPNNKPLLSGVIASALSGGTFISGTGHPDLNFNEATGEFELTLCASGVFAPPASSCSIALTTTKDFVDFSPVSIVVPATSIVTQGKVLAGPGSVGVDPTNNHTLMTSRPQAVLTNFNNGQIYSQPFEVFISKAQCGTTPNNIKEMGDSSGNCPTSMKLTADAPLYAMKQQKFPLTFSKVPANSQSLYLLVNSGTNNGGYHHGWQPSGSKAVVYIAPQGGIAVPIPKANINGIAKINLSSGLLPANQKFYMQGISIDALGQICTTEGLEITPTP